MELTAIFFSLAVLILVGMYLYAPFMERRAQRVAERYAPAYVIIDENFHILHFSGRTGRYIEPTAGTATLDLLSLVHRDLRLELRTALSWKSDVEYALEKLDDGGEHVQAARRLLAEAGPFGKFDGFVHGCVIRDAVEPEDLVESETQQISER